VLFLSAAVWVRTCLNFTMADAPTARKRSSSAAKNSADKKNKKKSKTAEQSSKASGASTPKPKGSHGKNDSTKKKKRKKQLSTPTDKKTTPAPTSGGTPLQKKVLAEYSRKAKKRQDELKPGSEEQKERDARHMVAVNCKELEIEVSNLMWPFVSEVKLSEDEQTLYLLRNQVNHNTISPSLSNEITNNFLDNPIEADLNGKVHTPDMGSDMKCILTYNTKASVPFSQKNLHCVNIFYLNYFYKM
jgi:hypothetical protein